MTFATAVPILFTSFVYRANMYWSVIHGIKRKPHLSVVWNWYHFVAIAILHQPRPMDSADMNTWLQLSDTSSIPPMHGGFLLILPSVHISGSQHSAGHNISCTYFLFGTRTGSPWTWMLLIIIGLWQFLHICATFLPHSGHRSYPMTVFLCTIFHVPNSYLIQSTNTSADWWRLCFHLWWFASQQNCGKMG